MGLEREVLQKRGRHSRAEPQADGIDEAGVQRVEFGFVVGGHLEEVRRVFGVPGKAINALEENEVGTFGTHVLQKGQVARTIGPRA